MLTIFALLLLQAAPVQAGEEPVAPYAMADANADARPIASAGPWAAFHEGPGVARIVDDMIAHSESDPRISDIFKSHDMVRLRRTLKEQFCYILGGGCAYSGRTMAASHKDLGIQQTDMGALVENLQAAMRREGVPFGVQNQLLAKLAPMHRDIVGR